MLGLLSCFLRFGIFLAIAIVVLGLPLPVQAGEVHRILFLHSYHDGFPWADSVSEGAYNRLAESGKGYQVYTEHLDVLRHRKAQKNDSFAAYLRDRYSDTDLDLVLVSDDAALDFALRYYDTVFSGLPIVFCGVSGHDPSEFPRRIPITGVMEALDVRATMDLAINLRPNVGSVHVFTSKRWRGTPPGKVADQVQSLDLGVPVIVHSDLSLEEIQARAKEIPSNSIVLSLTDAFDESGVRYDFPEVHKAVSDASAAPLFGFFSNNLATRAFVGGKMVSGPLQGSTAVDLAVQILHGAEGDGLAPIAESPNRYMFDYAQLQLFGISKSQLP